MLKMNVAKLVMTTKNERIRGYLVVALIEDKTGEKLVQYDHIMRILPTTPVSVLVCGLVWGVDGGVDP